MRVFVYGAGGHGKVVCDILQRQGISPEAFVESRPQKTIHFGLPVIAESELPDGLEIRIVIAIGDNRVRAEIARRLESTHNVRFISAIHPSADIAPTSRVGIGTVVCAGAIVGADTQIGPHCVINTGSQVDHDCRLGEAVSTAPGAILGGSVTVGSFSYIALGARLIHGVSIGEHSVIGAGATVVSDIGGRVVAFGSPCKVVRSRSEDDKYL